jgi:hypothetical protein
MQPETLPKGVYWQIVRVVTKEKLNYPDIEDLVQDLSSIKTKMPAMFSTREAAEASLKTFTKYGHQCKIRKARITPA